MLPQDRGLYRFPDYDSLRQVQSGVNASFNLP